MKMNTFHLMCFKGFECSHLILLMDTSSNNNEVSDSLGNP